MRRTRLAILTLLCSLMTATLVAGPVGIGASSTSATTRAATTAATAGTTAAATAATMAAATAKRTARPNVVLITADDMRADDLVFMPRTRALFRQTGVRFTEAISPYPLCCPARASLVTGQYAHNHGVLGNEWPYGGHKQFHDSGAEQQTLPVWLKRSGYNTAFIGKYLNYYGSTNPTQMSTGNRYVPPGWDDWNASVGHVFRYYCPTLNRNGTLRTYAGRYQTDLYTDIAEETIEELGGSRKPFFLWMSQLAPHLGITPGGRPCEVGSPKTPTPPAARHASMFEGMPLPHRLSRDEADMSDKGSYMRDRPPLGATGMQRVHSVHQGRLESLQALDDSVARTVATLKARGILDETVLVFTSDNGWLLGEHRAQAKILPYEDSLRVPLLARGPGLPAGVVRRQLVGTPDIAATVVDVAGAAANVSVPLDGVSLRRVAGDPRYLDKRVIPIEAGPMPALQRRFGSDLPDRLYEGVRSPWHSYISWQLPGGATEEELYDLRTDPEQLQSLHALDSVALTTMRELHRQLADCSGSECVRELGAAPPRIEAAPPVPTVKGDPVAPRLHGVTAPSGWIRSATATVRYDAADGSNRSGQLRFWCSHQAMRCDGDGVARLRLRNEGVHRWTVFVTDPAGNVGTRFGEVGVDLRPPRTVVRDSAFRAVTGRARLPWAVTDSASGVASVDTRLRTAGLVGRWTAWKYPRSRQGTPRAPAGIATPADHSTVCLQTRGRDRAGRLAAWSTPLCRARALDVAELERSGRWRGASRDDAQWVDDTLHVARDRGATLSTKTSGRVAVVHVRARTGRGQGRLRVMVGGTVIERLDLAGHRRGMLDFALPVPRSASGPVRATVISRDLPVWVDSVGVVRWLAK